MNKYDKDLARCLICDSASIYKFHQSSDGAKIFKCKSCEVQFMNPQYSDEYLTDLYSRYTKDDPDYYKEIDQAHLDCLLMIEKFCPGKGRLLDIGSGNGNLIYWAKERGWDPVGYDVDPDTVDKISRNVNVQMYSGKFEDLKLQSDSYDAVSMLHVIEHLKDPISYLRIIKNILKKEGILFIALPNIQSRSGNVKLLLEKLKIKRKNIAGHYDTGHHLFYFTPKTIRKVLSMNGFEVRLIYSGSKSDKPGSNLQTFIKERVISRFTWPSVMSLIAVKAKQKSLPM